GGRPTTLPWGLLFRNAGDLPRHPSQLYQFALEGLTLFVILWWFSSKARPRGQVSALFLMGYGSLRFIAEFAREPDAFLCYLTFGMTMGQWLCLPMIAGGIVLWLWSLKCRLLQPGHVHRLAAGAIEDLMPAARAIRDEHRLRGITHRGQQAQFGHL